MTTQNLVFDLDMLTDQVKPITLQVRDLQEGETVQSATVEHTPPSGNPIDIDATPDTPYVNMLFGPFTPAGHHFVKVVPVGSNGSKAAVLYQIRVRGG